MKEMNYRKYKAFTDFRFKERTWPDKTITKAPVWCSVDLRDGNQALNIPMSVEEKIEMFSLLVDMGFKEIEVGFPSASEVEYAFLRKIIEEKRIPDDVTVQILTQAREHLIKRSFEALKGVKKAIVHVYNSVSVLQRDVVFKKSKEEIKEIAVQGAKWALQYREEVKNPGILFEYSPESFTGTEMDYALEVCEAVLDVWKPTKEQKVIINLPATVEMTTSNVYADQIEWFCRNLKNRENILVSLHTHNDRGCAVAAAELALLAGADRVEGTLFGNGERTGNTDIVTMALNMFSHGVNPMLDFSDITRICEIYSRCTRMDVHARHPYAGELVYTAFSGSHQDAISKGMQKRRETNALIWAVPYLPIDPEDVGRSYESIIRINSQSGKGGVAYILETVFGFKLPKAVHPEFGALIQKVADKKGGELSPDEIYQCFKKEYLETDTPYFLKSCEMDMREGKTFINSILRVNGKEIAVCGQGNGPIDAFVKAMKTVFGIEFSVENYDEHALNHGSDSFAVAYIRLVTPEKKSFFGAAVDTNISFASIKAVLSALNRMKRG